VRPLNFTVRAHQLAGRSVPAVVGGAVACVLFGCSSPEVLKSADFTSPDAKWTATLEHVDNGAGFGQGALYEEVHLSRTGSWRFWWRHGNRERSVIFYVESAYADGDTPVVRWVDSRHLFVRYPDCHTPGKSLSHVGDVDIAYATFAVRNGLWCKGAP
jgi:hypothetical protein